MSGKPQNFVQGILHSILGTSNRTIFFITFTVRLLISGFLVSIAILLKFSNYYTVPDVYFASSVAGKVPTIKRDLTLNVLKYFIGPEGNSISSLPLILASTSAFLFITSWFGLHGTICQSPATFYTGAIFSLLIDANLYRYYVTTRTMRYVLERSEGEYMAKVIENNFGRSSVIEQLLNQLQSSLQCCGGKSYKDYERALLKQMTDQNPSFIPLDGLVNTGYLPSSCCSIEKVIVGKKPKKYCDASSPEAIKDQGCFMMILPIFLSVVIISNYSFFLAAACCGGLSVFMISSSLSLDEDFFFGRDPEETDREGKKEDPKEDDDSTRESSSSFDSSSSKSSKKIV